MKVFLTAQFDRKVRKFLRKHPDYKSIIEQRVLFLEDSPTHPSLKLHKLTSGEYAISVDHSIRIIFSREDDVCYLLTIGTHDEVY